MTAPSATAPLAPDDLRAVNALAARVGFEFPDAAQALVALTHKSFANEHRGEGCEDNERLEFLGDAVLDLAVSHRLMQRFPAAREGDLSKIRAALVDESALAHLARSLDLGPLLRLGRGEELTGGRDKASLLADALEAVVAVIYQGGGLQPVLRLLDRLMAAALERAEAGTLDRDYKTQLQETAQARLRATPRYRVVAEHGPDHQKRFEVEVEVAGSVLGKGMGRSKKDAEQAAARVALEALQAPAPPPPDAAPGPAEPPAPAAPAPPVVAAAGEKAKVAATPDDGPPAARRPRRARAPRAARPVKAAPRRKAPRTPKAWPPKARPRKKPAR